MTWSKRQNRKADDGGLHRVNATDPKRSAMRILLLCHRFPYPPNSGANIRSFNMISHLSRHHSAVVASLTRSDKERTEVSALEEQCAGVITAPLGRTDAGAREIGSAA